MFSNRLVFLIGIVISMLFLFGCSGKGSVVYNGTLYNVSVKDVNATVNNANISITPVANVTTNDTTPANNVAPTHEVPLLKSTYGTDYNSEDLIVYNQSTNDANGDKVKNIVNWRVGSTSLALLNLPLESSTAKDYSGNNNHATVHGAVFKSSGGHDGFGAYEFDGSDDFICLDKKGTCESDSSTVFDSSFTQRAVELWFYANDVYTTQVLFEEGGNINGLNMYIHNGDLYVGAWSDSNSWKGNWHSTSITPGKWYHVVNNFNANKNFDMYLNGVLINSTLSGSTMYSHTGDDALGAVKGATKFHTGATTVNEGYYFSGKISTVNVYARSLSAEQIKQFYTATTSIVSNETKVGDVWSACITPNDGKLDGIRKCSAGLTVKSDPLPINNVPEVSSPTVTPATAYTTTALSTSTNYTDSDSDSGTVYFKWYVNTVNVYNDTKTSVTAGSTVSSSLSSTYTSVSDVVSVSVSAYDGKNYSTTKTSSTKTISNRKPALSSPAITPSTATAETSLNASTTYNDLDNHTGTVTFKWYVDTVNKYNQTFNSVSTGTTVKSTISSSYYSGGATVSLMVFATDGYENSNNAYSTNNVTVTNPPPVNVAPVVTTPTVVPSSPYDGDDVTASSTYTDSDSDSGTVYFKWFVNTVNVYNDTKTLVSTASIVSSTLPTSYTSTSDTVYVSVFAYDGKNYSTTKTSSTVTVQQTPTNQTNFTDPDISKLQGLVTHADLATLPTDVSDYGAYTAYYVSTTGSDSNDGSIDSPFATLGYAVQTAPSNSVVYVRAGTYNVPSMIELTKSNFVLASYPGESVTLKHVNTISGWDWNDDTPLQLTGNLDNVIIDGFKFENYPGPIIFGNSNTQENIIFKNLHLHNFAGGGISNTYPSHTAYLVRNLLIKNVNMTDLVGMGINCGDEDNSCAQNVLIQNVDVYGKTGQPDHTGFDSLALVQTDNVLVLDSQFYNAPGDALDFKAKRVSVVNTIAAYSNRNGMKFWHDGEIINSIIYNTSADSAVVSDAEVGGTEFKMINSVVANHQMYAYSMGFNYDSRSASNIILKNNIFYHQPGSIYINPESTPVLENNVFYDFYNSNGLVEYGPRLNTIEELNAKTWATGNLNVNPNFNNPYTGDFTVQSGSSVIDAGTAISALTFDFRWNTRPAGNGIDIGPYETS